VLAAAGLVVIGDVVSARRVRVVVEPSGARTTEGRLFRYARSHRTGPLLHAFSPLLYPQPGAIRLQLPDTQHPSDVEVETRLLLPPEGWAATVPSRPATSVIVLLVESLRPDALRHFGGRRDVMPALDALAAESLRFQRTYAQASHSDYADLCPLASQYPLRETRHHLYPSPLPYPRVLLYDLLKALDYRTAIVSSQNETWGLMHNYLVTPRLDHFFDSRSRPADSIVDEEDLVFARWASEYGLAGKLDDRVTIDEAIRWIGESDRPFFMYVNLQNSHFPYRLPEGFPARFEPHHVDFPYTFANYPAEKVGVVRNRYDNSLAYVDAQIARLLAFLRDTGRLDRTIVVVSGDTGQAFMEHGVSAHAGPLFEEVVRVPLVVRAPGVPPGDVQALAEHVDVPPTVLGLLGLPPFPGFQGGDLLHGNDGHAFLVVQTPRANQVAVVSGRHKLIYDVEWDRYLLFDVVGDPGERDDLADREPRLRRALAGRLQTWVDAQLEYYTGEGGRAALVPPVVVPHADRAALLTR
jgi:arylsulfatase A-like enzyme